VKEADSSATADLLTILALWNIAVAQPLLDTFSRGAEFFIFNYVRPAELILIVVSLCIILPLIIAVPVLALKKTAPRIFKFAFVILVAILISLLVLPGLFKHYQFLPIAITIVTFSFSVLIAAGYFRIPLLRSFFIFLSPAILVIPIVFLSHTQIRKVLFLKEPVLPHVNAKTTTPIILVIFDEFPLTSLLNAQGLIDEKMYPNFAQLAKTSDWYRNATTVSTQTNTAIPAILTGSMPNPASLPIARDYPRNLFTLFAETHQLNSSGPTSALSPKQHVQSQSTTEKWRSLISDIWIVYLHIILPQEWTLTLPAATGAWGNFTGGVSSGGDDTTNPKQQFESFLNSIQPKQRPVLYFLHSDLPHSPWRYLPNGKSFSSWGLDGMFVRHEQWPSQYSASTCAYQRHILQVGFADSLVGKLISKLTASGLYEKSLVVITGDHGASFRPGDMRRGISSTNYVDIIHVPLFIKKPFQKEGRLLDWNVESIDILPTIAEILHVQIPWKVDGIAVSSSEPKSRLRKTVLNMHRKTRMEFGASSKELNSAAALRIQRLGDGFPFMLALNEDSQRWINASTQGLNNDPSGKTVKIINSKSFDNYDPESDDIPLFVNGQISFNQRPEQLKLGIAVNGKICAITETFPITQTTAAFGSLIPQEMLVKGTNQVQVLIIPSKGDNALLIPSAN
jgi:hypothetical protein